MYMYDDDDPAPKTPQKTVGGYQHLLTSTVGRMEDETSSRETSPEIHAKTYALPTPDDPHVSGTIDSWAGDMFNLQ